MFLEIKQLREIKVYHLSSAQEQPQGALAKVLPDLRENKIDILCGKTDNVDSILGTSDMPSSVGKV